MKYWTIGITSLALACAVNAQETPQEPDRDGWLMTSVSLDDLEYVVETQGHTLEESFPQSAAVMAIATNGERFFMQGTACSADLTCQGLHIWMTINGEMTFERANELNYEYAAVSVLAKEDDTFQISRYLILDHGTTMANIKANLLNALAIGEQVKAAQAELNVARTLADINRQMGRAPRTDLEELPDETELEDESVDTTEIETVDQLVRLE